MICQMSNNVNKFKLYMDSKKYDVPVLQRFIDRLSKIPGFMLAAAEAFFVIGYFSTYKEAQQGLKKFQQMMGTKFLKKYTDPNEKNFGNRGSNQW